MTYCRTVWLGHLGELGRSLPCSAPCHFITVRWLSLTPAILIGKGLFIIKNKKKNACQNLLNIKLNIYRNFVLNKLVTFDDKDPVWMNENIKSKIEAKNKLYQEYVKKGRQETDFCALEESVRNLNDLILQTKTSYYENLGRNLNDPTHQSKTYWSILKGLYNGKRVPLIPMIFNNKSWLISKPWQIFLMIFSANSAHL